MQVLVLCRAQESREWQQEYEDNHGNQPGGVRRQIGYPPERYGDGGAHLMWDDPRYCTLDLPELYNNQ